MGLQKYNQKRDFKLTKEPPGKKAKSKTGDFFCVQKHDATRLHYDFRLELDGVLLSWAVTKGPSIDPADKRLAVRTEDHPLEYGTFEGTIPEGQYGGGTVMLWDQGSWSPDEDPRRGLKAGKLKFHLKGEKLNGQWTLVRMRGGDNEKRENWLLIKDKDEASGKSKTFLDKHALSVKTGRTLDQIAKDHDAVWGAPANDKRPHPPSSSPRRKPGSMHSPSRPMDSGLRRNDVNKLVKKYPGVQLATLVDTAPQGSDWIHEIKFDGYRLLGYVDGGDVALLTRNGNDWTKKFPDLKKSLADLDVENAVLDMEAVVMDDDGKTNFQKLQNTLSEDGPHVPIHAYVFDLLHLNGKKLTDQPLLARKKALEKILSGKFLNYSDHVQGKGDDMIAQACTMGIEGIISKRADSAYAGARNRDWLKVKCIKRQEFIILGYTDSTVSPSMIGALHLGYYKGGKLQYAGKVGTGFTNQSARDIKKTLSKLKDVSVPDIVPRDARRGSHWVEPEQLAEIAFGMWTDEGRIRHASFHALRSDKNPQQVVKEMPAATKEKAPKKPKAATKTSTGNDNDVEGVIISHPERVIFETVDVTKLELAEYYAHVADAMLKDIKKHPVTLLRCPEGADHECFYQRNPAAGMGNDIQPFHFKHKGKDHTYFYTATAKGIVQMAQMGAIEIHPWGATVQKIDFPDRIIFDCDPGEDVPFEAVKLATLDLKQRLENIGLESFVKATGGKGLHVRVPIAPVTPWEDVKNFARALCEQMAIDTPEAYVSKITKSIRGGKIFLDFFRNDYTATAIADWAVRARPGAPCAVPLEWKDLKNLKTGNQFTMEKAIKHLKTARLSDDRYTLKQKLTKSILKSV